MAEIRYETETYYDAEIWIASRKDYSPWVEKDSRKKATQPEPPWESKLPRSSQKHSSKSTRDKTQLTPKIIENLQKLPAKMSLKRAPQSEAADQLGEKRRRQNNDTRPSGSASNYNNIGPGCSKRERSTVIGERDQSEVAVASSSDKPSPSHSSQLASGKCHRSSPVRRAPKQLRSMPIIDVDGPIEVISIDKDEHLQDERQPSEANSCSQSQQRASGKTTASKAPPQPSTSVQRPAVSDHHDHQRHSQARENSRSNFQPIITEVRTIRETNNNQTSGTDGIPNNEPCTSHHLPSSPKMSVREYSEMNGRPSFIQMHEPDKIRFENIERLIAIAARNASNIMDQRKSSPPPERQEPTVTLDPLQNPSIRKKVRESYDINSLDPKVVLKRVDNTTSGVQPTPSFPLQRPNFVRRKRKQQHSPPVEQCQQKQMDVPDALQRPDGSHSIAQNTSIKEAMMHEASTLQRLPNLAGNLPNASASQSYQNNPGNFHQEQMQDLRSMPTEGINPDQLTRSGLQISMPEGHLISTSIAPNQTVLSSNSSQQRQSQYHRDIQQQPRPSEPQGGIPSNASNDRRLPTVQGVTQRCSPPHVQPSIPDSIRQSLTNTYIDDRLHFQQSKARLQEKSIDQNQGFKVPSQKIVPAATGEIRSLERPSFSSQQDRKELLNSKNENMYQPSQSQQYSECNIANPSALRSPPRSADHEGQTDKHMKVEPASPEHSSSSDPEIAVDHGVINVIIEQKSFANNPDCAGTSGGQGSASTNNQTHNRNVIEQQMLDHFSTILTQMGSNLYYSCEMYKNLRSSILETADTYKKLIEVAEGFNALRAAESAASLSSTMAPRILPLNEERQTGVAKRPSSSNHNQHSSKVDKEPPNKKRRIRWKIVLPPEYDPHNTEWSLKYRKMVPELKEVFPGRGIYVNSTKLKYAERVSDNCSTLASLVLEEVFSETALIVCSTWHESRSPEKCWIERPPLDPVAYDALFSYVIRYGGHRGWNIDTGEIIKAMDNKIYEIRVKHGVMAEPYSP